MHADATYHIGAAHEVCEDYALAGAVGGGGDASTAAPWVAGRAAVAIVADGCSSSRDTDVGARLLARAAGRELELGGGLDLDRVIRRAALCAATLGLGPSSLDATLLLAESVGGDVRVTVAGDGVVAARRRGGGIDSWTFDHGGAPSYLSYRLEPRRLRAYRREHTEEPTVELGGRAVAMPVRLDGPTVVQTLTLERRVYDVVTLISDGIETFHTGAERVPLATILEQVFAFKTTTGAFLRRRLGRLLGRYCATRGWRHDDDLAVAAVYCDEEVDR